MEAFLPALQQKMSGHPLFGTVAGRLGVGDRQMLRLLWRAPRLRDRTDARDGRRGTSSDDAERETQRARGRPASLERVRE